MGETIRIEIPVSVNDNTDPGLSNITNKMNTLATEGKSDPVIWIKNQRD